MRRHCGLSVSPRRGVTGHVRHRSLAPVNVLIKHLWHKSYPEVAQERWRDMYHSYYPYLFDHGDSMSLYPKIPSNPREWQPSQLLTTYDAIREDKYDAFIRLRTKYPELYQDTQAWENPPPFGEYNMFYSKRFGLIGAKAFTSVEFDELGNKMELTAFWCPDNQVVQHKTKEKHGKDAVVIGCTNVPVEFHKPYVSAAYKANRVPVKHVSASFRITPDAFVPVGTRLDVRHFRVGQEVDLRCQETDYGVHGTMTRLGHDGGPVWLGDSKWQRRIGSIGTEGAKRVLPGKPLGGQTGAGVLYSWAKSIYRIDYKNSLIYVAGTIDCDVGAYCRIADVDNVHAHEAWNVLRGLPPFPTFVPPEDEDLGTLNTDECQLVSEPLHRHFRDEPVSTTTISTQDMDDAKRTAPAAPVAKKEIYDHRKFREKKKEAKKRYKQTRAQILKSKASMIAEKRAETMRKKHMAKRKTTQTRV